MEDKILDGKALALKIREDIKSQVNDLKESQGITPGLAVILAGNDPASISYVNMKEKACIEGGFYSEVHRLSENTSQSQILSLIDDLNNNKKIHGILVQLPLDRKSVV